jgi:cation diffusion facilitator family transporter
MHQLGEAVEWDPFPPNPNINDLAHRHDANRAIGVSALGLGLTGLVELAFALLSGSVGLLGDSLHNLSDVSTSLAVFVGFKVSKRPATPSNPYGFERAEDIAGLGVALAIWASAAFAAIVSVHKLTEHGHTSHVGFGIAAAAVGIVGNQVVARYKKRVGVRIRSATLIADARHSWLDALSSAGALLGLVGVVSGYAWADGVAGLVVTAFIVHVGWEVTSDVLEHLLDGVDPGVLTTAEQAALLVPEVDHVHVRARWMGRTLLIDIEGFVPATTTVKSAEALGRQVEGEVLAAIPECRAVLWSARELPDESASGRSG